MRCRRCSRHQLMSQACSGAKVVPLACSSARRLRAKNSAMCAVKLVKSANWTTTTTQHAALQSTVKEPSIPLPSSTFSTLTLSKCHLYRHSTNNAAECSDRGSILCSELILLVPIRTYEFRKQCILLCSYSILLGKLRFLRHESPEWKCIPCNDSCWRERRYHSSWWCWG